MPLTHAVARREIHHRVIDMQAFERDDGLYDIEARLVDRKPFPFVRMSSPEPTPAGQPLHDLSIRLTVDRDYVVVAVEAASDTTPWALCRQAEGTLAVLVGEKVGRGWSSLVKSRLRGTAGCTHLTEMLIPMATTALQGIRGIHREQVRGINAAGEPVMIDTCYSYARTREVARVLWPVHHVPAQGD